MSGHESPVRRTVLSLAALALLAMAWHLGRLSTETGTGATDGGDKQAAATAKSPMPERRVLPRAAAEARAAERPGDALTLLALGRATGDPSWLGRALADHPDDPRVQLERWRFATNWEARVGAADALRQTAPENQLGSYLSMMLAFQEGDLGAVAGLLSEAEDREGLETYGRDILLETQAAFKASGLGDHDAWEAAVEAARKVPGSRLEDEIRFVGSEIERLQNVFVQLGYWDEADYLFDRALSLGEQLGKSGLMAENQAGLEFQRHFLMSFDPETVVSDDGTRVGDRVREIRSTESLLYETWSGNDKRTLDADDWERYRAILRSDGEFAAERWLGERQRATNAGDR